MKPHSSPTMDACIVAFTAQIVLELLVIKQLRNFLLLITKTSIKIFRMRSES
jgi:hypothetical protein